MFVLKQCMNRSTSLRVSNDSCIFFSFLFFFFSFFCFVYLLEIIADYLDFTLHLHCTIFVLVIDENDIKLKLLLSSLKGIPLICPNSR